MEITWQLKARRASVRTFISRHAPSPLPTRRTASPVFIAPLFTGENDSTVTLPPGDPWKNAETAVSSAVYLQRHRERKETGQRHTQCRQCLATWRRGGGLREVLHDEPAVIRCGGGLTHSYAPCRSRQQLHCTIRIRYRCHNWSTIQLQLTSLDYVILYM